MTNAYRYLLSMAIALPMLAYGGGLRAQDANNPPLSSCLVSTVPELTLSGGVFALMGGPVAAGVASFYYVGSFYRCYSAESEARKDEARAHRISSEIERRLRKALAREFEAAEGSIEAKKKDLASSIERSSGQLEALGEEQITLIKKATDEALSSINQEIERIKNSEIEIDKSIYEKDAYKADGKVYVRYRMISNEKKRRSLIDDDKSEGGEAPSKDQQTPSADKDPSRK